MKQLLKLPLAGTLLVSYLVYSSFISVSTPHSIILFSLVIYAGFSNYLQSHQLPSLEKQVADLRKDLEDKIEKQKEEYEAKLQELKEEQSRQAIAKINSSSSSSIKKPSIQF